MIMDKSEKQSVSNQMDSYIFDRMKAGEPIRLDEPKYYEVQEVLLPSEDSWSVKGCRLSNLENGQYNEAWKAIHFLPGENLQAAIDLKAKRLPVHSSKFDLALHDGTNRWKKCPGLTKK